MYEIYCDTYYLTKGLGRSLATLEIVSNPNKVPGFILGEHEVIHKNNEDYLVDSYGGSVKVKDLNKYNIEVV